MKKLGLFFLTIFISLTSDAQTFKKKVIWKGLFNTLNVEWVDIDNDSLLDVALVGKDNAFKTSTFFLKNKIDSFVLRTGLNQNTQLQTFSWKDINHDNLIDYVQYASNGSVYSSTVFLNKRNFLFEPSKRVYPSAKDVSNNLIIDLNNDGQEDWIIYGTNFIKIFEASDTVYQMKLDSSLVIESILIRDFNKDGLNDLVVSGSNKINSPQLQFWVNKGDFKFTNKLIKNAVAGKIESGDFNHDGWFDLIVAGKNSKAVNQINYYKNDSLSFNLRDSISGYGKSELLLADLDSDGLVDLSFQGVNSKGKKFNRIRNANKALIKLDTTGLITQRWGDYDRDGDLDLLTISDSMSYKVLSIYTCEAPVNKTPVKSGFSFAFSTFNKTFIYWDEASDDLTPAKALTYDLYLGLSNSITTLINPEFRYGNKRRLLVSHGNQTTNHFAVINNLADARYNYLIQPVDNAFNGGVCYGGGVIDCFDLKHAYVQACKGEMIELKSSAIAYWFSTSKGFLKISSNFRYEALATDTIVSVVPQSTDCNKNNIWVVRVNGSSKAETQTKFFCENSTVKIGIEPGWKNIVWTGLSTNPAIDSVSIKVVAPIKLKVTASSSTCVYTKEFTIGVSKPMVSVTPNSIILRQGESTQLTASGAKKYLWTPAAGLDNNTSSSPIATPIKPTKYIVQGIDSIGCIAHDTVDVNVVETAFIPALFTPNGDGKNDDLKILGLTYADDFQFTIFNREGVVVYESKEIVQAATRGWDGSNDGNPQPSGLYYWKIVGRQSDGQPLRLNGKTKGSILLVR